MGTPRIGVWEIEDGKIKTSDYHPEGTIIFAQLGVLANLQATLRPSRRRPGQRQART